MAINGVVFDLDDTLLMEVPSAEAAFIETCRLAEAKHGIDPEKLHRALRERCRPIWYAAPAREFCVRIGVSSWEALWAKFEGDLPELVTLREWIPTYRVQSWSAALAAFNIEDVPLVHELSEAFGRYRRRRHVLFDDTLPVLQSLGNRFPLALITNGLSCLQREKIDGSGLAPYFRVIAISGDVGVGKPDPKAFEHLINRFGIPASQLVMVGNGLRTDIKGAQSVGMQTILVDRGDPHAKGDETIVPDITIPDLTTLDDALAQLQKTGEMDPMDGID